MINFSMVDVKNITSTVARSNFAEADLENLADLIIETGGIVKPLVVKMTGVENYTVVDGHFEYYAAVRAREKNSRKGEMVNAFVVSSKVEDLVLKQVAVTESLVSTAQPSKTRDEKANKESSRIANLELRLEKQLNELKSEFSQERQRIDTKLKQIENQIPKQISPLDVFNNLSLSDLALRLRNAGFSEQQAVKVAESVEKERNKKKFEALSDVVERIKIKHGKKQIKGITSDRMVILLDTWSRTLSV
ncbi:ParB/Srx family N-terminal domain-containing protein [aff. Roholtiella sp. LEGE 12411]|uniref:ParB/Srx family N-terminal domain-containing protein n=1 Tax=aff. Roholtiella sp. LEGE 12411 TaxID=1828822 RepID=UPI00187E9EE7|nr:ParB/Srx family N-terminal domain-containing protein [aff. Roholtiella sp. LEGE 12411]MBE9038770.1 chromosome partitioning protein ParB [aff. Roholtiella sp. LEGE 12411]